jgi:hypothetical protein
MLAVNVPVDDTILSSDAKLQSASSSRSSKLVPGVQVSLLPVIEAKANINSSACVVVKLPVSTK